MALSTYYTKAEFDSLVADKIPIAGTSDDIEWTDATKGPITRHADATRVRTIVFKDGSNYVLDSEVVT